MLDIMKQTFIYVYTLQNGQEKQLRSPSKITSYDEGVHNIIGNSAFSELVTTLFTSIKNN